MCWCVLFFLFSKMCHLFFFFFQAEDGIRDHCVTGVQTCALPILVEADPPFSVRDGNPAGHYGTSKMAGEAIGLAYASFQDVDFISLRVTAIYGFGMRSPMYIKPMVENAVRGVPTRFATGGPMKRDYTHVLDCCEAIMRALDAPRWAEGEQRILNVAAGR